MPLTVHVVCGVLHITALQQMKHTLLPEFAQSPLRWSPEISIIIEQVKDFVLFEEEKKTASSKTLY